MSATVVRSAERATLAFTFSQATVDALKAKVPAHARSWSSAARRWEVIEPHVDAAIDLLRSLNPPVHLVDRRPVTTVPPPAADWLQALRAQVPEKFHSEVARALIRALHPDRHHGDPDAERLTKALTQAFRP